MAIERKPKTLVRFGRFEADLDAGQLRKSGRRVKLQDQPFRVLAALLERPGEVVSRDALRLRIWPDDTFVDFTQGLAAAIYRVRKVLGDRAERPRFVETVPRRGYRFVATLAAPVIPPPRESLRLAILPFANISSDPEDEYLSDGLTEELIHALTQVQRLRVISRTSAFAYKGKQATVREVADTLNVEFVLEGSVRKEAERIRVTAQLVNAVADYHLWSDVYDRELEDLFSIQKEIALKIVNAVCSGVRGEPAQITSRSATEDHEAYDLYLKGRYFWGKRNLESLKKGLRYFEEAARRDPRFVLAHAGVADSHTFLAVYGGDPTGQHRRRAVAAAQKALEIDDSSADAYVALGSIHVIDHRLRGVHEAASRARELNPGLARARHFYAMALAALGRLEEAIEEIQYALTLDPLAVTAIRDAGRILYYARRYDEAAERFQAALEIQDDLRFTRRYWGLTLLQQGKFEEALAQFGSEPALAAATRALMGEPAPAIKLLAELAALPRRQSFWEAALHVALGDHEQATLALEAAYERRPYDLAEIHDHLMLLGVDPYFAPLGSHRRFVRLVKKIRSAA